MTTTTDIAPTPSARSPFAPPVVRERYTYTVTFSGEVTAIAEDGSLTIGDYTVPRRTGNGVSMCMIGEPADPDGCSCTSDLDKAEAQADSAESAADEANSRLGDLLDTITLLHDESHHGAFKFCAQTLCRRARDLTPGQR